MSDKTPRKNMKHYDIVEYWKDKAILENGRVVELREVIGSTQKYLPVFIDIGEPCCWACDKPVITSFEKRCEPIVDVQGVWDEVKGNLQKCHIIPRSKGGEDVPSNLFLMCEKCHEESPDTVNSRSFFRWVYDQRKRHVSGVLRPDLIMEKVTEKLKRRGIDVSAENIAKLCGMVNVPSCDLYEQMKKYMGSHIGTHFHHFSESSMIEGLADWLVHEYVNTCLK